jgi:hypothetical protein
MIRFATDQDRHSIIGTTGSGKTQAALWHLSHRNFHLMPWLIYDYKREQSINAIEGARHIELDEIPDTPGIYIAHPHPDDTDAVEKQMWAIWNRGNTGVYVDEGYMVGRHNRAFRSLLTQGRSKSIPMIVLSQRPVWMDNFVFSESQFFQVFRLQFRKDVANVESFVPVNLKNRLPEYHSYYYDVGQDRVNVLKPVPAIEAILGTFERRLRPQRKAV